MFSAITEVNNKTNQQPHYQSSPIGPAQAENHGAANKDTQYRHKRNKRGCKLSLNFRIFHPKDPYPGTDQYKRKQGSYTCHITYNIARNKRSKQANQNKEDPI